MARTFRILILAVVFITWPGWGRDALAQASKSVRSGAYTDDQATKGESVYRQNCTSCHATSFVSGEQFQLTWLGRTVFDLYDQIRKTMPQDDPGKLSPQDYALIVAYVLKLNGYPSGSEPLSSTADDLKQIRIEAR